VLIIACGQLALGRTDVYVIEYFMVDSRPTGDGHIFQTLKARPPAETDFHDVPTLSGADAEIVESERSVALISPVLTYLVL